MIKNALRLALAAAVVALAALPASALAFPPGNDAPGAAVAIPAAPAFVSGTTVEATLDADEPSPLVAADDGGTRHGLDRSVWFTYRPDKDIKILADTCDANFTSHIDVYTGGPGGFGVVETKVNSYRDCPGDRRSFSARAGTLYWIRVSTERDGVRFPDGGNFHLRLTPQTAPLNDAFSDATPLSATGTFPASLAFASLELGEPSYREDTGSIWYRLTPSESTAYNASVGASATTVTLQVFESRGSTINRLRRLGQDYTEDDYAATVAFNALKGKTYYIRLGTSSQVPVADVAAADDEHGAGPGPAGDALLEHPGERSATTASRPSSPAPAPAPSASTSSSAPPTPSATTSPGRPPRTPSRSATSAAPSKPANPPPSPSRSPPPPPGTSPTPHPSTPPSASPSAARGAPPPASR